VPPGERHIQRVSPVLDRPLDLSKLRDQLQIARRSWTKALRGTCDPRSETGGPNRFPAFSLTRFFTTRHQGTTERGEVMDCWNVLWEHSYRPDLALTRRCRPGPIFPFVPLVPCGDAAMFRFILRR